MKPIKELIPFKRTLAEAKTPTRKDHPLTQMRRDMDRMLERFFEDPAGSLWPLKMDDDSWFGDFSPARFAPSIDLADKKSYLELTAELPGLEAKDIRVKVEHNLIHIDGEKRVEETSKDDGYYRTERSYGRFERNIPLPVEVDGAHVEATFDNGVLHVKLPKAVTKKTATEIKVSTKP
jgi:HSP20 family protein